MAKGNHEAYSSSAGKGTPYWYEWSVGLLRVVEMLYPESEISSVSFQEAGIKGWDDVVVRYTNGRTEYIQVKHSREGTNITFGSFVSADTDGVCLLESLFGAWRGMKLSSATAACVVFTNREAGERVYEGRPPLLDFMAWVKRELKTKKNLTELVPPNEWKNGWDEWRAKLCAGTNEEQSDFIRALSLNTSQPDLLELQTDIQRRLAGAFGTSVEKALPLLQAFNDALKDWTVRNFPVTAEDAFKALVLPGDLEVIEPAPPPPAPFFPTREKEAREIENALVREDAPPVFFLSAAPGAGKTSVLSRIELRRTERRLGGIVGLRYFAYRPITPESPLIPADADFRVRPESLWFSLLSQFRRELDGRLNHYRVPIRNNLLSWQEARAHVLRLADRIGTEIGRRFVMVIDGIDHAARAGRARYDAETARDFFASLPGPEELSAKCIRLMVAGQPAEFYPEYPTWLRASNPGVQRMELGPLQTDDIAALFGNASPKIPYAEWDTALDEIADTAKGNTLAIVFAVEEAKQCGSVIEFKARLQQRGLREGLQTYYESIWKYAFANVRGISDIVGTETALAGSLSLLKERVSGKLLATCFSGLGLSASQWLIVLANLGPVIVSEGTGFRVLHNDIRIFLANYLGTRPDAEKRWVYSALADYYLLPASDRRASHASLLSLLQNSERLAEWPRVFTVDWVFEAAAYAVPFDQILSECEVAMRASVDLRDWNVLHELTCASETIVRWQERTEANEPESEDSNDKMAPFFPPSELTVLPFNVWTISEIHQVTRDVEKIVSARELSRGAAILARWFDGLTVSTLGDRFFEEKDEEFRGHDSPAKIAADAFKTLGAVCREAGYYLERGENLNQRHNKAHFFFEQGWIGRSCSLGPFVSLKSCFRGRIPMYFNGCSLAICELAAAGEWKLVGRLLTLGHANRQKFSKDFRLLAPWFCLRSGIEKRCPGWLEGIKISEIEFKWTFEEDLEGPLKLCQARGWLEPQTHPGTIAKEIYEKTEHSKRSDASTGSFLVLFRTAAVLGRLAAFQTRGKLGAARDFFRISEIRDIASALWADDFGTSVDFYRFRWIAGDLAVKLVQAFYSLSKEHAAALIEIARPIAERSVGDHRVESLWLLFRLSGDFALLRKWLHNILGPSGWVWEDSADSRRSTAEKYIRLAREIGETALADDTQRRLGWFRICYRGHKDYSLAEPITWFAKLAEVDPTCIRRVGYKLLALSEACSAQGDNRSRWDLNKEIGACAIAAGPNDVYRLLLADQPSKGTWEWLGQARARFIEGLTQHLLAGRTMSKQDSLICWSVSVGMSRWYESDDVTSLTELKGALLVSKNGERSEMQASLSRITPGDADREAKSTETHERPLHATGEDFKNWREHLTQGLKLSVGEALWAIRELDRDGKPEENLRLQILESIGPEDEYSGRWAGYKEIAEIAKSVPESSLWSLVKVAVEPAGHGFYWWHSATENLQSIILARSVINGAAHLESGLLRIMGMHERWARGGDMSISLPVVSPGPNLDLKSWAEFATQFLTVLLSSRAGTVIGSVLTGVNALVASVPGIINELFSIVKDDEWKIQWLLTAAEVWALEYPHELSKSRGFIEQILLRAPLHLRLQSWIILSFLAQRNGGRKPPFSFLESVIEQNPGSEVHATTGILFTEAKSEGMRRLVNRYESARGTIERVQSTTGADFSMIEPRLAPVLLAQTTRRIEDKPWPQRIRNMNDSQCVGEETAMVLDREFSYALSGVNVSDRSLINFAYGYLHSEDGWVLRQTPQPHPSISEWPNSDVLAGGANQTPSTQKVRSDFRTVAYDRGIASDEIVIGAKLNAFSWKEDFEYCCWWQEADASGDLPTTVSGRSFPWILTDAWWEPNWHEGRRPVCFFSGGQQQLLRCSVDVVPSRIWISLFGWRPSYNNPFLWMHKEELVARYEILHGPLNSIRSHAGRQPILHRWVAKRDAWERITKIVTSLQWREDFRREASNAER